MDSFWIIVLFLLASWYFDKRAKKKPQAPQRGPRPTLPPQPVPWEEAQGGNIPFEIPKIKGAPGEKILVMDSAEAQAYEEKLAEEKQRARRARLLAEDARAVPEPPVPGTPQKEARQSPFSLTPESAREAVLLAEILGKPKAHRRRL